MRIVHLTAGTGSYHCGTCLRDHTLVKALRRHGHDAAMVPLYLPLVLDDPPEAADSPAGAPPLFFGGVSVYLQQKSALFRHTPVWLDRVLNAPALLRRVSRGAAMTRAAELGEITVSMLRGEEGRQAHELDKLARWLEAGPRPDVVALSNLMLIGVARELHRRLGAPVVCSLQGEDGFLDALPAPHRDEAWRLLAERADDVAAFVAPSAYFAEVIRRRLDLAEGRVTVIHNGIEAEAMPEAAAAAPASPAVGYLARLCAGKGLGTLVEAFILLKTEDRYALRPEAQRLRLRVAGAMVGGPRGDAAYVAGLRDRLAAEGLEEETDFLPNLDPRDKPGFLRSLAVFSVPATYGEAFGLYLLEAWAAGVPAVQPRHAAFPELLALSGAGRLCAPDDTASLAEALADLLAHPAEARALGERGREAVRTHFSADRMARSFADLCEQVRGEVGAPPTPSPSGRGLG